MKWISYECTIREVGFQTNWHFDQAFIKKVYLFYEKLDLVDYLELGFLNANNDYLQSGCSIYRDMANHTTEINQILTDIKGKLKISAMYDMHKIAVNIPDKANSIVDMIRILVVSNKVNFNDLEQKVIEFRNKGYNVGINYVNAGSNTMEMNRIFAEFSKKMGLDCIYFADSDSSFTVDYVNKTIDICNDVKIECAMHLHNRAGMANILLKETLKRKLRYIDFTILGLGGKFREGNINNELYFHIRNEELGADYVDLRNELIDQIKKYG